MSEPLFTAEIRVRDYGAEERQFHGWDGLLWQGKSTLPAFRVECVRPNGPLEVVDIGIELMLDGKYRVAASGRYASDFRDWPDFARALKQARNLVTAEAKRMLLAGCTSENVEN